MQGVGLDRKAGLRLDLLQQVGGKEHIEIEDLAGLAADEMAVGIGAIAVEPAVGPLEAFDHAG